MIAPPPAAQDLGPWRIDLLLAIWPRIARAVDTMHGIGAVGSALTNSSGRLTRRLRWEAWRSCTAI